MFAHTYFPQANIEYVANFGDKGNLAAPPAKQLIVGPLRAAYFMPLLM